jgi:hypothetical protein
MASLEVDNNCINCEYRHEKSTFGECVGCVKNSKKGNQFPGWKPVESEAK